MFVEYINRFMQLNDIQSLGDMAYIKNYYIISKENYEGLLADYFKLQSLIEHGVDNWEGYSDAMQSLNDE